MTKFVFHRIVKVITNCWKTIEQGTHRTWFKVKLSCCGTQYDPVMGEVGTSSWQVKVFFHEIRIRNKGHPWLAYTPELQQRLYGKSGENFNNELIREEGQRKWLWHSLVLYRSWRQWWGSVHRVDEPFSLPGEANAVEVTLRWHVKLRWWWSVMTICVQSETVCERKRESCGGWWWCWWWINYWLLIPIKVTHKMKKLCCLVQHNATRCSCGKTLAYV